MAKRAGKETRPGPGLRKKVSLFPLSVRVELVDAVLVDVGNPLAHWLRSLSRVAALGLLHRVRFAAHCEIVGDRLDETGSVERQLLESPPGCGSGS